MSIYFTIIHWAEVSKATGETLQMMLYAVPCTAIIGLPLGILLYMTYNVESYIGKMGYRFLSLFINVLRSVPFVILMIAILPFTRFVSGTTIGIPGTIPPLVIAAAPFFARLVENVLREVDLGVIEAARAMGASTWQMIYRVLLPEALPGLIASLTVTSVTLVSYTAMSGLIGGGGLGDLAIRYGYYRYEFEVMIVAIIIMIVFVQLLQWVGDLYVRYLTQK